MAAKRPFIGIALEVESELADGSARARQQAGDRAAALGVRESPVMAAGDVSALVRQTCGELLVVEDRERPGADDDPVVHQSGCRDEHVRTSDDDAVIGPCAERCPAQGCRHDPGGSQSAQHRSYQGDRDHHSGRQHGGVPDRMALDIEVHANRGQYGVDAPVGQDLVGARLREREREHERR
jgi:hypothetical protein